MAEETAETGPYRSEYCIFRQYVKRHKNRYEWCWRFNMSRQDQLVIRVFFDVDYGTPEAALDAARAYRQAFMEAFPPVTNLQRAQKIRTSNKSGIPGVYRYETKLDQFWRASVSINGKEQSRTFSIAKYGEQTAKKLAIAERQKFLEQINPDFLRVPEAAQQVAETHFPEYLQDIPEPKTGKWLDDETYQQKLAEIDAQYAPGQTRARRLYINANLVSHGKVLGVFISNWQQKENFKRGFAVTGDISGPLAKARAFLTECITKIHGEIAARAFMATYGDQFQPEIFATTGQFRQRLIESGKTEDGAPIWQPVER